MVSDIFKTPILNTKVSNTEAALEVYEEVRANNKSRRNNRLMFSKGNNNKPIKDAKDICREICYATANFL